MTEDIRNSSNGHGNVSPETEAAINKVREGFDNGTMTDYTPVRDTVEKQLEFYKQPVAAQKAEISTAHGEASLTNVIISDKGPQHKSFTDRLKGDGPEEKAR